MWGKQPRPSCAMVSPEWVAVPSFQVSCSLVDFTDQSEAPRLPAQSLGRARCLRASSGKAGTLSRILPKPINRECGGQCFLPFSKAQVPYSISMHSPEPQPFCQERGWKYRHHFIQYFGDYSPYPGCKRPKLNSFHVLSGCETSCPASHINAVISRLESLLWSACLRLSCEICSTLHA